MVVEQLPEHVREFARHLAGLLARLDPDTGWYAVFGQRDPDGMRACLDGREVPPWDVVEALLQDLAGRHGAAVAASETGTARALHRAALTAYDALPGARDALGDRLDVMLREQRYAAERQVALGRLLAGATTPEAADALRRDLAWARDDHTRATARCAEIRARMAELDRAGERDAPAGRGRGDAGGAAGPAADTGGHHHAPAEPARPAPEHPAPAPGHPVPAQRRRRRGGARFAGSPDVDATPVAVAPDHLPEPLAAPAGRTPGGARFAGAMPDAEPVGPPSAPSAAPPSAPPAEDDRAEAVRIVEALARLRAEGRSGEAHALLAEAARGPAARFPLLAEHLDRAGLGADRTTLLWEAASLPADRLAAAAEALTAAGREADGEQVLRQGVVRPGAETGSAVLALAAEGRHREARALLDACVRARTPQQAARVAEPAPPVLVPLLLDAARAVSAERHRDLVHALRVAGLAG